MSEQEFKHPSFGKITLHRTSGHGQRCYGSDLDHDHTMSLTIHESSYKRDLSHDHMSLGKTVIEVHMTPLQWAEFLSSQGMGDGIPCTIAHRAGAERIPPPPVYRAAHHEVFKEEAQERIDRATDATKEAARLLDELMAGGPLKKSDLKAVQSQLNRAVMDMQSNVGFVMESFEKATAKVVNDAKEEINAHHSKIVQDYGLRALAANIAALEEAGQK